MKDFTDAPFYAIGGSGYGKGFTRKEAVDNYVASMTRGMTVKDTIFKSRAEMDAYFRTGPGAPLEWEPPKGTTGFVLESSGPRWEINDEYVKATEAELLNNPHWVD